MNNKQYLLNRQELLEMGLRFEMLIKQSPKPRKIIAENCGITSSGLTHFTKGERQPSDAQLDLLAEELNTTPEYILFGASTRELFMTRTVVKQNLNTLLLQADNFYPNLTAPEKIYVYCNTRKEINLFRLKHPGGMTFDDVKFLLNLSPTAINPSIFT